MIQAVNKQRPANAMFAFEGFPYGLNTAVPPTMLNPKELPACVDFRLGPQGQLIGRKPVVKLTTGTAMTGDPVSMATAVKYGTQRDIIACSDYKIYYLNGTVPTLIGTVLGTPYLIPFDDACLICDGSRLKYLGSVTEIKQSYDAGSAQYDNYSGSDDTGISLWSGEKIRAAAKFTTGTWDTGYTMPITQVDCFLKRVGSPTGAITIRLRAVSDDSILAAKAVGDTAADISDAGEFVSVTFSASDITTEMSRATDYYASVEYSGGDDSNYIQLRCTTETGPAYSYVGSWTADTTKTPIIKVYPGMAPKCSFGVISNRRPWLAGDPDNPGYVWYGYYSFKDFSTTSGGGYLPVIDDNANTFEVGAIQDLYGQLFVYGTESQPYLSRLTGTSPTDYALPLTFQKAWSTQRALVNTKNDLWSGSSAGVDSLSGVQAYGDFRSVSLTESVEDRLSYWRTSTAFAGYYPDHALYLLHLPLHGKTLVGHTKNGIPDDRGQVRYPWTEFDFPVTPTDFGQLSTGFVIGADDGHLYGFSSTTHLDLGTTQIPSYFYTAKIQFPSSFARVNQIQYIMECLSGAAFKIDIYTNGDDDNYILQIDAGTDGVLLDDATTLLTDATMLLSTVDYAPRNHLNFTCHTVQLKFHTILKIKADDVYFNGCFIRYQPTNKV